MIKISGLEKRFSHDFVLKIDELNVAKGDRVAVIGPNGSGKSTLLRILSGAIKQDCGHFSISDGTAPGYLPQSPYCFAGSVEFNVRMGLDSETDIEKLLRDCMLYDLRKKKSLKLSGGEKQRMCFARMLAGKYACLMLDEPFSCTDIETSQMLEKVLDDYCRENDVTLLFSTHLPSQAFALSTKVLILNNGEIAEYSNTSSVSRPDSEFGRKFINQWRIC